MSEVIVPSPPSSQSPVSSAPIPLSPTASSDTSADAFAPVIIEGSVPKSGTTVITSPTPASPAAASEDIPVYKGPATGMHPMQPVGMPAQGTTTYGSATLPPPSPIPSPAPQASAPEDIVHGFAKSVPLAVALRQILPTGHSFSIDQGVDMGTLVSFQGGHPWRETLRMALAPVGLVAREQGQMVAIGHAMGSSVFATSEARPAMASASQSMASEAPVIIESPKPVNPNQVNAWTAQHGDSLHKVLEDWCQRAHAELEWHAEYDYPLEASVSFTGTFEDAVRNILVGFEGAHPQPVAELHANARAGQMVLVVQTRGNSDTD